MEEKKNHLKILIEQAWDAKNQGAALEPAEKSAVLEVLNQLDDGALRIAECIDGEWLVNEWLKKAILLSFKIYENKAAFEYLAYDKIPLKFHGWGEEKWLKAGFRVVPGAVVRHSSYISPKAIIMPSFINIGAYIGGGTLIDTWATIGSCAQIGSGCHISGGVGIGGVLEPLQANPVIIEDNVFIGARSEIAEGVIVEEGAVISMGVFIGSSTRIYDRATGQIFYGRVPKYSVVVPGTLPSSDGKTQTYAVIIVKQVDEKTRAKTSINELLRAYTSSKLGVGKKV
ncbi:MAG: dapD [Candidatus Midichloriaceae bacterium]|jgi:2,3,4,5-tetrahydropyridine-2-carboxylate N-succinyltransferase|nr:dapD [Candidatus Midichloriaceae bacterium]